MSRDPLFQVRQNRLLAGVRAVQAGFSVLAATAEADRPGLRGDLTLTILLGYFALSLAILAAVKWWRAGRQRLFAPAFVLDFLVFAVVLHLTIGSVSPYFLLFIFLVLSATMQWGWRGAAWTTLLVLAVFATMGLMDYRGWSGRAIDLPRFVMRIGNLVAIGWLLVAFGRYQERVGRDMARLSGPLLQAEASDAPPVFEGLERACSVFGVERALFVWGDPEEPGLTVAELAGGNRATRCWTSEPAAAEPVLTGAAEPFLWDRQGACTFRLDPRGQMARATAEPGGAEVLHRHGGGRALVLPVAASSFCGWVILPDFPYLAREQLYVAGGMAAQIGVAVEAWRSLVTWREAKASEQRVRLARELHDGVLQFLAATDMQLQSIGRTLSGDDQRQRIRQLQEDLRAEQLQLRALVTAMSPRRDAVLAGVADIGAELQTLASALQRQWNVTVSVSPAEGFGQLPPALSLELPQMLRETVSNAVRHGGASAVRLDAERLGGDWRIVIADNGRGLEQKGRFEMEDLERRGFGPRSLRSRVAALGGRLTLLSESGGATLLIDVSQLQEAARP